MVKIGETINVRSLERGDCAMAPDGKRFIVLYTNPVATVVQYHSGPVSVAEIDWRNDFRATYLGKGVFKIVWPTSAAPTFGVDAAQIRHLVEKDVERRQFDEILARWRAVYTQGAARVQSETESRHAPEAEKEDNVSIFDLREGERAWYCGRIFRVTRVLPPGVTVEWDDGRCQYFDRPWRVKRLAADREDAHTQIAAEMFASKPGTAMAQVTVLIEKNDALIAKIDRLLARLGDLPDDSAGLGLTVNAAPGENLLDAAQRAIETRKPHPRVVLVFNGFSVVVTEDMTADTLYAAWVAETRRLNG